MKFRLKQLTKDSTVYGLGDVVTKAFLFLLLSIYTRVFAPAEYGAIETLVEIWNGESFRPFRRDLRKNKAFLACTRCGEVL